MIQLYAENNLLTNVNLTNCSNLQFLNLNNNQLTAIDLSGYTHLENIMISGNQTMDRLNLSGCIALISMQLPDFLKSIDLSNCSALTNFVYLNSNSLIETVNVQGCSALGTFHLQIGNSERAPLTEMNFSGLNHLYDIVLENTNLASIDISGCTGLTSFRCYDNYLTAVDFSDSPLLQTITIEESLVQTLDFSNLSQLQMVSLNFNPQLTTVFPKNGSRESLTFTVDSPLLFVCQDEAFINRTREELSLDFHPDRVVNSYCSITPGGDYNTITGWTRFDGNNNGCDTGDTVPPNIRVNINDGTNLGSTFTTANGNYTFYTEAGSFDLTPNIENPDWFSFAPATATIAFSDNLNHTATQDFCITAIGTHNDAEIIFAPVSGTRPGFTSTYLLTIRNKGNQMLSGTYNLNYDGTLMNFVSAGTVPTSVSAGVLNWTYSNLQPFENRAFYVEMNVNTPTQMPPVNIDDILTFTATINPIVGDANPLDNQFVYNEVVIGSFDPNNITCLQGETVAPDAIGDYLHYIVNFENTGNAAAENVVVKLEINPNEFDVNSLQLLHASHASFSILKNNTVEFKFPNINLRPSAGDPPVNGHGNILFKIKSKATLEVDDVVKNKAEIFFDYNFPIETNDAETTFRTLANTGFETDNSLNIHPNPTHSLINLKGKYTIKSVELFDIQGRVLQTTANNSDRLTLDISDRQNGLYFIKITTEKGVNVEKIIKK